MKTLFRTLKFVIVAGTGAILVLALGMALGQGQGQGHKESCDISKSGLRLIMGHKGRGNLHCTEGSLITALNQLETNCYKVHFDDKNGHIWDKGNLQDVVMNDVTPGKDTGGPTPAIGSSGDVGIKTVTAHSTQNVAFSSTQALKDFITALVVTPDTNP